MSQKPRQRLGMNLDGVDKEKLAEKRKDSKYGHLIE